MTLIECVYKLTQSAQIAVTFEEKVFEMPHQLNCKKMFIKELYTSIYYLTLKVLNF